jgi:uncharacterized protein (TIGR00106 family)
MLVTFSMFPVGKGESISREVAKIIDIIDKSGLRYQSTAMATTIEGNWEDIMKVINRCRLKLRKSNNRIYMHLTMDDRKKAKNRMKGKIDSIEKKLKRNVSR